MSSHHVVTDQQRGAIILANGEQCSFDLLGQALDWGDHLITLDGATNAAIEFGLKVDYVIGDLDSILDLDQILKNQSFSIIRKEDQDSTDLEKAFNFCIKEGIKNIKLFWATGKRSDHLLGNLSAIAQYSDQLNIELLDDYLRLLVLPKVYKKWYPKKQTLSLIPFPNATGIKTKNLLYPLQDEELSLQERMGTSNEVLEDGIVSIEYSTGVLFLAEVNS